MVYRPVVVGKRALSIPMRQVRRLSLSSWKKTFFFQHAPKRGVAAACERLKRPLTRSVTTITTTSTPSAAISIAIWSPRVIFGGDREEYNVQEGTVEINPSTGTIQACFPGERQEQAQLRLQNTNNIQLVDLSQRYSSFSSLCPSPGLIDVHTHISSLGRNWEGYTTATQAAAAGGITTIIGMPLNSLPPTISADIVEQELQEAKRSKLYVDVGLWGGVLPETAYLDDQLGELLSHPNVLGLKAFLSPLPTNAGYQAITAEQLLHVAQICGSFQKPILVHSELMTTNDIDKAMQSAYPADGSLDNSHDAHVRSRPPQWEQDAVKLVVQATQYCDMHIVHLSDALGCLPIIKKAKDSVNFTHQLTVETCPHYLLLDSHRVKDGDTQVKCFPPIREPEQREALWQGLATGLIDMVASDHSPCEPSMREHSIRNAWGGLTGLQYQLAATWTASQKMSNMMTVTEADMAKWWCQNPAKLAGLQDRGSIETGKRADFVVWDTAFTDCPDNYSKEYHKWKGDCYYSSKKLQGRVLETWLHGSQIYDGIKDRFLAESGNYINHRHAD